MSLRGALPSWSIASFVSQDLLAGRVKGGLEGGVDVGAFEALLGRQDVGRVRDLDAAVEAALAFLGAAGLAGEGGGALRPGCALRSPRASICEMRCARLWNCPPFAWR